MIRYFFSLLFLALFGIQVQAQVKTSKAVPRPKLVVGLVVDQMRWDYLYRYYERYGETGFKRILREGFSCENTYINYVPTVTAIGHSTVYTGSVPAIHGIAGNNFIMQENGYNMYCTEDTTVKTLGAAGNGGKMSPKNLLSSTITDELRLSNNFQSKVIGISLKDRGAILPAGHFGNAAYWMDDATGNWISSTYYMQELPKWVSDFNNRGLVDKYLRGDWKPLYPINTYTQSIKDNNPYESRFKGIDTTIFPVYTSKLASQNGPVLIKTTPFGNTITLDLAKEAIKQEKLGANKPGITDFLAVSLSSTDYIGHHFAVNSAKVEDAMLRLDIDLGSFLQYLDQQVGKGQYTIFLTADHGAAHNAQYFMDIKGNGGFLNTSTLRSDLNKKLKDEFGQNNLVISLTNYQVHFNKGVIKSKNLDEVRMKKMVIQHLKGIKGVAFVADMDNVGDAAIPELLRARIINGYHMKRSGDIQFILEPQYFTGTRTTGTSHSAWNPYDSRIPLLWMGWGIRQGKSNIVYNMTDIASTVAAILQIQEPNGNIGKPITEVVSGK
jgi:predicted AlkP superfamily pyrophosphatase or phosphodiesterase